MENLETYLYIFFAVVYIISRVLKAKSKQKQAQKPISNPQQQPPVPDETETPVPRKAFSFEDILKDFEKSLAGEPSAEEQGFPVEEIKHEIPKPVAVEVVEEEPNKYQRYRHKSYKEGGAEIIRKKADFSLNENYRIKKEIVGEYVKMLRDPDGAKNAIILSAIINPKYF